MEQSRRRAVRAALIVVAAIAVVAVVSAVMLRRGSAPQKVEGHLFAIPGTEDRLLVEVFNATPRKGLARTATRLLREQGIDVVFLGNADSTADSTRVIVRRGDDGAGLRVQKALGFGRVVALADTMRRVDVTVVLGADFLPQAPLHP